MINPQKFFNFFMPSVISFVLYFLILFPISSNYLSLEEFGIRATVLIVISIVLIGSNFGMVWLIRSFYFKLKDEEIKSFLFTLLVFSYFTLITFSYIVYNNNYILNLINWNESYFIYLKLQIVTLFFRNHELMINELWVMNKESDLFLRFNLLSSIIVPILTLFLLVYQELGLLSYFFAELVYACISFVLAPFLFRGRINFNFQVKFFGKILRVGYPAVPKNIFGKLNNNIMSYMLVIFFPISVLGLINRSQFLRDILNKIYIASSKITTPNFLKSLNENKNYNVSRIIKSWYILSGLFLIVSSLFYIDFLKLLGVHEDFIDTAFYAPLLCIRNYIVGSFFFHSSFLIYKEVTHINSVFTLISLSTTISIFYKFYNLGIIALIYSQAAGAVVGVGFIFIYCRKLGFSDFSSILGTIILSISLLIHYLSFNLNFSTLDKLVIFIFFSGFFYMIDKVYNNQFISENINLIFRGLYDGKAQR